MHFLANATFDQLWNWFNDPKTTPADRIAFVSLVVSVAGGFLASLLGAWFGASAAFRLGRRQQKADLEDKEYNSIVETLYMLLFQFRTMEFIQGHANTYIIGIGIPYVPKTTAKVRFEDLVHTHTGNPLLLHDIYDAELQYLACLEIIADMRVKAKEGASVEAGLSLPDLVETLQEHLTESLPKYEKAIGEVDKYMRRFYPSKEMPADVYSLVPPTPARKITLL